VTKSNAQTTPDSTKSGVKNLGNEDINVYKEYTPVLNDAFKMLMEPKKKFIHRIFSRKPELGGW
jgi:hypothetical protein